MVTAALAYAARSPPHQRGLHDPDGERGAAYEVFADAVEIPRWLPLVQTARILVAPRRRPADARRVHAQARARIAGLHARVRLRPVHLHHHVGDAVDVERRDVRRGALRAAVHPRLPDAVPPGPRPADRRRPREPRARRPPGVARRRRVSRAPPSALLGLHSLRCRRGNEARNVLGVACRVQYDDLRVQRIVVSTRRCRRRERRGSIQPTPTNDNLGHVRTRHGEEPSRESSPMTSRTTRRSRDQARHAASPRCTMHFQPIVHAAPPRAVRLRGAAALDGQGAAASRRDPRRRRAAREDHDARPRGARAEREGDRRRRRPSAASCSSTSTCSTCSTSS